MKFNPFRNNTNKQVIKELQELKVAILKNSLIPRIRYQGFIIRDKETKQAVGSKDVPGFYVYLNEDSVKQQLKKVAKNLQENYEIFPVDVIYTEERQEQ
jgi:hypothetical protein